jgi:hypothetical protein
MAAKPVPNRAHNRTKYYITNGGLGTDNQKIRHHAIHTPQGRAAMRREVDAHAERTGKTSWAFTESRPYDESSQKVQYKKEK